MILKLNRKSKGKTGVVEYLLNEREKEGTAITLRGNPSITKAIIKTIERKHKYLSGGLMFAKEEYINDKQKQEIMDSFEEVLFAGIDSSKYNILWVEHTDKERIELNFVVPRMALDTGNDLDLYSHRRDLPLMDMWKNGINLKYKLADPNDPRRSRSMSERTKVFRGDGYIVANRKTLDETLHELVKSRQIQSRNQMIELLKKSGYQITRKNEESISVKHIDIGKKALRLKGGIYSESFISDRGIERISEERERRISTYDTKLAQGETQANRNTYQKYLQARIDRHKKRYERDTYSDTKNIQDTCTKSEKKVVEKYSNDDRGQVEYDRIRVFIEESRRKREESYRRARKRTDEVFRRIDELDAQLQKYIGRTEYTLHRKLAETRGEMESYIAENAKRLDEQTVNTDSKRRKLTERIRGLLKGVHEHFENVRKSIGRAVFEIAKTNLFKQASEDELSEHNQMIRWK